MKNTVNDEDVCLQIAASRCFLATARLSCFCVF